MEICNILPNNCISEDMPRQHYELYLTHQILKDKERFAFLNRKSFNYKILDNSACELGEGLDFNLVLQAAEVIGAQEVVLPDLPQSSNSLSYTLKYLKDVPQDLPYKLAAVVQGETKMEILACAEQLLVLKRINTIMIPKWYCQMNSTNGLGRHDITKEIVRMMVSLGIKKDIHWLGLDTGMRELITPIGQYIRSCDTGYLAAMSTPQWSYLDITDDRPRELKINLDQMDVNMPRWNMLVKQQKNILEEVQNV